MDLDKILRGEYGKKQCGRIVRYVGDDPDRFATLIRLFFSGEYRICQRAARPLSYCVKDHPRLIRPYFNRLLLQLEKPGIPAAVTRNSIRVLQELDIPVRFHGKVMDICFRFIQSPEIAVAPKAFALTVLQNLTVVYPEILPEIKLIIEARWEQEGPAFRSRARKILQSIKSSA
jgi:hypothetical protein